MRYDNHEITSMTWTPLLFIVSGTWRTIASAACQQAPVTRPFPRQSSNHDTIIGGSLQESLEESPRTRQTRPDHSDQQREPLSSLDGEVFHGSERKHGTLLCKYGSDERRLG